MGNKLGRRRSSVDERYTKPQGLYQHRDIDHRKLRRLILDSKLAPCYAGAEDPAVDLDECPICFLHYPSLNRSKCCTKGICTECFLQMKSPHSVRPTQCPYCKTLNYAVEYRGIKSEEEKGVEQVEEQKVIEAKIRMQQKDLEEEQQQRTPGHLQTDYLRDNSAVVEGGRSATAASYTTRSTTTGTGVTPELPCYQERSFLNDTDSTSEEFFSIRDLTPNEDAINTVGSSHIISSFGREMHTGFDQGSTGSSSAYLCKNRDEFDLDLEDIMLMEAIWLSIQEQDTEKFVEQKLQAASSGDISSCVTSTQGLHVNHTMDLPANLFNSGDVSGRSSLTGGLAGVIAEMAERHITGGSIRETQSLDSVDGFCSLPTCSDLQPDRPFTSNVLPMDDLNNLSEDAVNMAMCSESIIGDKDVQDINGKVLKAQVEGNSSIERTHCHVHSLCFQGDDKGKFFSSFKSDGSKNYVGDSSECQLACPTSMGSSQKSSNEVIIASYDSSEGAVGVSLVPKNFEDQIKLAMALSLAEAQIDCQSQHVEEGNCQVSSTVI